MEKTYEEDMLSVHTLAFALLCCRSEKEAFQILRHFTKTLPRKSYTPEPEDQSDGASKNWR